ncbi:MAG: formate dehydrogenase subunit alpha [Firmicutes bacterium]|nr:formate dehydrogenase subunit alpha [Bacillota bacterium]
MALVTLTIDGKETQVEEGTSILEAAKTVGIEIPSLCYLKDINETGKCRVCVVEVEKSNTLMASCVTPVANGMVVGTNTERVRSARRTVLELILSNHRTDCLTCEKNGDCKLQDYAYEYGLEELRFPSDRVLPELDDTNPFFIRDLSKCILCGRCISVCSDIQGQDAIALIGRGFDTKVAPAWDKPLEESPCVFCGNCVQVCPVGALTPKYSVGKGRFWEIEKVETTCPYCGTGCLLDLHVKNGKVVGASGADGPVNEGWTCVKGRFGLDFIHHPDRLTVPLIREGDGFKEASWDEALELVASKLGGLVSEHGSDSVAFFSSAKCTNEVSYLMQKLARAAVGTNNVDHCARLCHSSTVAGLATSFGSGAMTNSIHEIADAKAVFIIGSNTTENHPVIGIQVKEAVRRGAKLIVADPRDIELAQKAHIHMKHLPGTDVALLNGMMNVIIEKDLHDKEFIETRTENFEAFKECVSKYTPEYVSEITGVPAELIVEAAVAYATADTASLIYSMGITQHSTGTDNVLSTANIAMLTGNLGKESVGVNPLRGQNNVQGACDMGALPVFFPGYQSVTNPDIRSKFEKAWGRELPSEPGLTVTEAINVAYEGDLKGLYIIGENPMVSDPDINHVEAALKNLDFLVVQDIFLTETAELADVVLPSACFAEQSGTFTSTERRVQLVRKAIEPPGEARSDWEIICDISTRLGYPMNYSSSGEILDEIASLTPIYGGITSRRLDSKGLQWPCPTEDHPGTPYLHKGKFSRGLGLFSAIDYIPAAELPDEEYPLILTTGRILYHFHTGSMTRRTEGLHAHRPEAFIEIRPDTAEDLGIVDGEMVQVSSRRGKVEVRAKVTSWPAPGVVFMPFHFAEAAANILTNPALDPKAKIPEFKVCAVRIDRLPLEAAL